LLHPSLRCEKMKNKVIPMLGIDARNLKKLAERVDICTVDVTFTTIRAILFNIKNYMKREGNIITLIKPLFETEFYESNKFKIITDSVKLRQIMIELMEWSIQNKVFPYGIIKSPLLGEGGSIEFFIHYRIDKERLNYNYKKSIRKVV
ncbi:MAG: hypothetical protein ACFFDO_04040, partial [Candidatus Thorarchaeota archaeon]